MKAAIIIGLWIVALAAIAFYLFLNLRKLWRSAKRFGSVAARLARAPGEAAERHPAREPDGPTPAPFHNFRRKQASEDLARVRRERSAKRQGRLERATGRWDAEGDSPYAHFDREKARADYDALKERRAREKGGQA